MSAYSQARARITPPPEPVPFTADSRSELPAGSDVVVVGGGMVGASAAYRLALAGLKPLVIEANAPASGASGRLAGLALAGLGGHFERVTRLVQESGGRSILDYTSRSLDLLDEFEATLPGGIEWERCGSLDLLCDDVQEAHGRVAAEAQSREGLDVQLVGADELRELAPALDATQARVAKWTPRDGKLNPFRLVYGLLEAAQRLGATVVTGVRVESLLERGGRLVGVATTAGDLAADAILLATNAWTPALVPHVANNLTPIREHVLVTEQVPQRIGPGFETNLCNEYWRQMRTGEVLIGGFAAADDAMGIGSYSMTVRPQVPPQLAQLLIRMHPALRDIRVVRSWAGLLDFASLEIPMVGRLTDADGTAIPGGYLACGFTGHGLPYAPIMGLLLAELIASGEARTLPLEPFSPARYAGGPKQPTWLGAFEP
ncbi:MAG TPA: FAD-binding oxidoreductase [Candidatus Limnocylindria bacterium]|nr:FAD-binding oxidoreductase [Candidatus Limnocylindria bacterium]